MIKFAEWFLHLTNWAINILYKVNCHVDGFVLWLPSVLNPQPNVIRAIWFLTSSFQNLFCDHVPQFLGSMVISSINNSWGYFGHVEVLLFFKEIIYNWPPKSPVEIFFSSKFPDRQVQMQSKIVRALLSYPDTFKNLKKSFFY